MIINAYLSSRIVPDILVTELEFSRQILEKCTNIKFREKTRPVGVELFHADGQICRQDKANIL